MSRFLQEPTISRFLPFSSVPFSSLFFAFSSPRRNPRCPVFSTRFLERSDVPVFSSGRRRATEVRWDRQSTSVGSRAHRPLDPQSGLPARSYRDSHSLPSFLFAHSPVKVTPTPPGNRCNRQVALAVARRA